MRKIAFRLILLVMVMVLGVVFFIWYRSSQAPTLLELVPAEIRKAGFIDTRNLVKKSFKTGASAFNNEVFPEFFLTIFEKANSPKEPGINLYSELVWFEHVEGFKTFFVKLAYPEKWEEFLIKNKSQFLFDSIMERDEIRYCRLQDYNVALGWRGKHLAILYDAPEKNQLSISDISSVLLPKEYSKWLTASYHKLKPDIFYLDISQNSYAFINLIQDKVRYQWVQHTENKNLIESMKVEDQKLADKLSPDTSVVYLSSTFIKSEGLKFADFNSQTASALMELLNIDLSVLLTFYNPDLNSETQLRIEPITSQTEINSPLWNASERKNIVSAMHINPKVFSKEWEKVIPEFFSSNIKRFYWKEEMNSEGHKIYGTCYLNNNQMLPFGEVADFLATHFGKENIQIKRKNSQ